MGSGNLRMGGGVAAEMSAGPRSPHLAMLDFPVVYGGGGTEVSFLVTSFEVTALNKERELSTVTWR